MAAPSMMAMPPRPESIPERQCHTGDRSCGEVLGAEGSLGPGGSPPIVGAGGRRRLPMSTRQAILGCITLGAGASRFDTWKTPMAGTGSGGVALCSFDIYQLRKLMLALRGPIVSGMRRSLPTETAHGVSTTFAVRWKKRRA